VEVDTNAVVPIGLVVAELLGNALRHAFPGDRCGEVRVTLSQSDGCRAHLTVHDNGVGLPDDIDLESSPGFGLRMIAILRRQIGATVEIDRSSGTSVQLVLPALLGGAP
jgi:two-component sensor histidine kinase